LLLPSLTAHPLAMSCAVWSGPPQICLDDATTTTTTIKTTTCCLIGESEDLLDSILNAPKID
jgi:hypothetical protein